MMRVSGAIARHLVYINDESAKAAISWLGRMNQERRKPHGCGLRSAKRMQGFKEMTPGPK